MGKFATTTNKGFQITFDNGWTASVQFGPGNYCEHHEAIGSFTAPMETPVWESHNAEVWAWKEGEGSNRKEYPSDGPDGWRTTKEVMNFLATVACFGDGIPEPK